MGRIIYSVSGEGRGHAARARALAEALCDRHEIRIYCYGQSYEMLEPVYRDHGRVEVRPVEGMEFQYNAGKRLDYVGSLFHNLPFLMSVSDKVAVLESEIVRFGTDLLISDFEPLLPRAAFNTEIPFITLDHQSFLVTMDLKKLPLRLQAYATFFAPFVHTFYPPERVMGLVSSFFDGPVRKDVFDRRHIGVLLRPEVRNAVPRHDGHILAYVRRDSSTTFLDTLATMDRPVKIYGLGEQTARKNLTFHPVDAVRFVEDLAGCEGLVCTAGNQLIGEAIHLGKPILAMPEKGNFEQDINAYYIRTQGAGMTVPQAKLSPADLKTFLRDLPTLAASQKKLRRDGTAEAVAWVEGLLSQPLTSFDPVPESPPALAPAPSDASLRR